MLKITNGKEKAGALDSEIAYPRWCRILACAVLLAWPAAGQGQGLLYDNGPLVNSPGTGVGGADESVLQNLSLGLNVFGFGHQLTANNRIADDFTVPDGQVWHLETVDFYAYQTNSSTTSTMTSVNVRIWDGPPGATGSNVIFGDTTTNRLQSTGFSGIYRVTELETGVGTARPIMLDTVQLNDGLILVPGAYWLDWQTDGSLSSGPWAPPITINGLTTTGNGQQSAGGGAFASVTDSGTGTQQGFPFRIYGESLSNGQCISMLIAAHCEALLGKDLSNCVHEQQETCHEAFAIPSHHVGEEM